MRIFVVCGVPQRLVHNRDTSLCGTTEQKSDLRALNPTLTKHQGDEGSEVRDSRTPAARAIGFANNGTWRCEDM
jgi:hypothetical protein